MVMVTMIMALIPSFQHPDIQARRLPILFFANKMDNRLSWVLNMFADDKE